MNLSANAAIILDDLKEMSWVSLTFKQVVISIVKARKKTRTCKRDRKNRQDNCIFGDVWLFFALVWSALIKKRIKWKEELAAGKIQEMCAGKLVVLNHH